VLMDTETTGLAGGTGTVAFMLGLARPVAEGLHLRQYLLTSFGGEAAMLEAATAFIAGAEQLVTYNGKSFDAPLLAARHRLARLPDPFARLHHVDLLHPVRRAFGTCWPDTRLQRAEQRLLGFVREGDLPGAEAPLVWGRFLRTGDLRRLPALCAHNLWDLLSVGLLIPALEAVYRDPHAHEADALGLARALRRAGDEAAALRLLARHPQRLGVEGRLELARLYRRRGDWPRALALWQALAEQGEVRALEALAKYHEHQARDLARAHAITLELIRRDPASVAHRRRLARLETRLAGRSTRR